MQQPDALWGTTVNSVTTTLEGGPDSGAERWRLNGIARCRGALAEAEMAADRLALLRSWIRLEHGWLSLATAGLSLSPAEASGLARFGLALSADGTALRLEEPVEGGLIAELDEAMRLDTSLRTFAAAASPDALLRRHLDFPAYRTATQKSAVRALLTAPAGAGLLVSMPTGSGKSLLFQLPTLLWRQAAAGSCCVVITPTVSLALDHALKLGDIPGLEGSRALTGDLTGEARQELLASFRRGEVPVLFMSPELALGPARGALVDAARDPSRKAPHLVAKLAAFIIDEAHIVESWGRTFRPDFQRLPALVGDLRAEAKELPVALLSATLTPAARRELRRAYGGQGPWLEIEAGVPRYDCDVVVQSFGDAARRDQALQVAIDRAPRPLIVYTTEVARAASLHAALRVRGYRRLELFTGDVTDPAVRKRIVEDWSADKLDLVVATSAFGLGIDKTDVRSIIHACLPEAPARWHQEIGRASRDGRQGLAVTLFTISAPGADSDTETALGQASGSWLSRDLGEARWRAMLDQAPGSRLEAGVRHLMLNLDARRDGLSVLTAGDYNRVWNMSLLNLMQRAQVLEVVSVGEEADGQPGHIWEVAVRDPQILMATGGDAWDRIFAVRDAEADVAKRDLAAFSDLMTSPRERCLQASVYGLVRGDEGRDAPPCGRCPACRSQGHAPPRGLRGGGLEAAWPLTVPGLPKALLPPGVLLVPPEDVEHHDGLERLVQRLARVGVEQILAPQALVPLICEALAASAARLGLILSHDEWLHPPGAALTRVPTAMLLGPISHRDAVLVARYRALAQSAPDMTCVLVAAGDRRINDRRLDQALSGHPPYPEAMLDALASGRNA